MLTPCCTRLRSSFWGRSCASQAQSARSHSRTCVRVCASLSGKGKRFPAELITVKKIMGEGTYGQVFEGGLDSEQGPARVVLKRVKKRVEGAEEMGQMEHLLNVYASKAAKGSIADFVGYVEVDDEEATAKLTQGLWLMWRYQGSKTLSYYLRRRDCIAALAEDLGVEQEAVVPTVFKQVLESVAALHAAGLVHRDVKPMNIIFAEDDRSFKLIDLGACADLRSGTNYVPDESILDPTYCPPEQYCMPTDAPHLAKHGAFAMAMSPLLWQRFKPDKFDSYSAGLCLMQLAVPKLRSASGLLKFNSAFKEAGYDLGTWRDRANLPAKETAILDAEDAAGWELAEALLRPRAIDINGESGRVKFVNTNGQAARLGVSLALNHRFIQLAQATSPAASPSLLSRTHSLGRPVGRSSSASSSEQSLEQDPAAALAATSSGPSKGGLFSMAMGVWKTATSKLFDLEAKIANQTDAVSTQTARVKQLKDQAATGKVSVSKVKQEESVLTKMKGRLTSLTSEFNATAQSANRLLGSLMNKGKGTGIEADSIALLDSAREAASSSGSPSSSRASSRRSDLPPSLQRARQQVPSAADAVLDSAQLPDRDASKSPRAAAQSPASDRQQTARPKVARRNITRITSSNGKSISSSSSTPSSSLPPDSGSSDSSNPGVNMLYAGLKFTGLALNVAGDLAKAVRQDAEKMMKDLEADTSAKKLAKEQAAAFVDLLRDTQPGITSATSLSEVESVSGEDDRWLVMPADTRQQIFRTYTEALKKIEDAARQKAASGFKAMLAQSNVDLKDDWSRVQEQLASSPAFSAVESDLDRRAMFQDHVAELQEVANQAAAAARHEEEFWGLLETQDPPLTRHSSWLALRRLIYSDPRYTALPDRRCRQLFNQYHSTLRDLQSNPPSPAPPLLSQQASTPAQSTSPGLSPQSATKTTAGSHADSASVSQLEQEVTAVQEAMASASMPPATDQHPEAVDSRHTEDALELLRQEQAQLKREYDRMQAKLLEMEALLRHKESGIGPDTSTGSELPARSLSVSANGSRAAGPDPS